MPSTVDIVTSNSLIYNFIEYIFTALVKDKVCFRNEKSFCGSCYDKEFSSRYSASTECTLLKNKGTLRKGTAKTQY
jgi:hypothetical protein